MEWNGMSITTISPTLLEIFNRVTFKLHRLVKKKLPNKQNPFLFITASQPNVE
jgi:hypothetical protein